MNIDEVTSEAALPWPSLSDGAVQDWIQFRMGPFKGRVETVEDEDGQKVVQRDTSPRAYNINVSFMLSNWACIFGRGCPGVLMSGAIHDTGCCQIGVHIDEGEKERIDAFVEMLTEQDCDNLESVRRNGYAYPERDPDYREQGNLWHTYVVDGACVLANRAGGPTGKLGCSLHVLAERIGVDPNTTKPNICWKVPISVNEEWSEANEEYVVTVGPILGSTWGVPEIKHPGIGWWCTETPDAFVGGQYVYRYLESNLRRQMGDDAYERMAQILDDMVRKGDLGRYPAAGQKANGGRPMLPLLIKRREGEWLDDATDEQSDTSEDSRAALARSKTVIQSIGGNNA